MMNVVVRLHRFLRRMLALLGVIVLPACAGLPSPAPRAHDVAFGTPQATDLGKMVASAAPNAESSGFRLLQSGEDAFAALNALIQRAQRSLDLQYYLVRDEVSSRKLLREVYAAARRGVRIRLLVDDLNTAGEEDLLLCLEQRPEIEVRLFNPFPSGRFSTISRVVASATDMRRIGARMHNKQLVADNAIAVTGGRNLGDAYFVQSKQSNFLDLDLLVAGPAVRRLSASFDAFWNNDLAYPIGTLIKRKPDCNGADPVRAGEAPPAPPLDPPDRGLKRSLMQGKLDLTWASTTLLADKPAKTKRDGQPAPNETVSDDIEHLLKSAQREVLVISPYFVPGPRGLALFEGLRRRGVTVRVLTNSLAATDAPAVHIGYARYRMPLIEMGVTLYELRPHLGTPRSALGQFGSSRSSLHAKALVIDRGTVLVGSMNLDPRSANLNSEIGLVLKSPRIAAQLVQLFEDVTLNSSYHVQLHDGYHLRWTTRQDEKQIDYDDEPEANPGLRLLLWVLSPLAPEAML